MSAELVPGWDVYREGGEPVTVTAAQVRAIWHAVSVVEQVRRAEGFGSLWENGPQARAELAKSRLLGRMLFDGLPPTRTKPPTLDSGPCWRLLPGGDPFAQTDDGGVSG